MNYIDAKEFIKYTDTLGIKPGLDTVKELLRRLDNPQDKLNLIHVAGTNGKGSICAYLEYGFRECGLTVGRYISPTLFSYLERFQINGEYISEDQFSDVISVIKEQCENMVKDGFYHPTSFEVETAAAFLFFLRNNVELVLLETGMGGKEDATNVSKEPLATVFSSISYDHMGFLGNTIEEIAGNKAGIMRKNVPVIASFMPDVVQNGLAVNARETLLKEADRIGAPIYFADNGKNLNINNPLMGEFQSVNLATALLTFDICSAKIRETYPLKDISKEQFIKGIEKTKWPGRYETLSQNPLVIRDGAHNEDAARLLKETVQKDERIKGKLHLIMGCFKDKSYRRVLEIMLPLSDSFTAVNVPNVVRGLPALELLNEANQISEKEKLHTELYMADSVREAYDAINCEKTDTVLIFGSLSLAAMCEDMVKL